MDKEILLSKSTFRLIFTPIDKIKNVEILSDYKTLIITLLLNSGDDWSIENIIPIIGEKLIQSHYKILQNCFGYSSSSYSPSVLNNSMLSFLVNINTKYLSDYMISNKDAFLDDNGIYISNDLNINTIVEIFSVFLNISNPEKLKELLSESLLFVICYILCQNKDGTNNIDIYNVCSDLTKKHLKEITFKGKDYFLTQFMFTCMLKILEKKYTKVNISLMVDFLNKYYESAARLYLSSGFGNPRLDRRLLCGSFLSYPMTRLDAKSEFASLNMTNVNKNLEIIKYLKHMYLSRTSNQIIEYKLGVNINNYLNNFLKKQNMTYGVLISEPIGKDIKIGQKDETVIKSKHLGYLCLQQLTSPDCMQINIYPYSISISVIPNSCNQFNYFNYFILDIVKSFVLLSLNKQYFSIYLTQYGYSTIQYTQFLYNMLKDESKKDLIKFIFVMTAITILKHNLQFDLYKSYEYSQLMNTLSIDKLLENLNDIIIYLINDKISLEEKLGIINLIGDKYAEIIKILELIHIDLQSGEKDLENQTNIMYIIYICSIVKNDPTQLAKLIQELKILHTSQYLPNYIKKLGGSQLKEPFYICRFIDTFNKQVITDDIVLYYHNIVGLDLNTNLDKNSIPTGISGNNINGTTFDIIKNTIITPVISSTCDANFYMTHPTTQFELIV